MADDGKLPTSAKCDYQAGTRNLGIQSKWSDLAGDEKSHGRVAIAAGHHRSRGNKNCFVSRWAADGSQWNMMVVAANCHTFK